MRTRTGRFLPASSALPFLLPPLVGPQAARAPLREAEADEESPR
jgi:hypothetical protein